MKTCLFLLLLLVSCACSSKLYNLENPQLNSNSIVFGKVRMDKSCGLVVDVKSKQSLKESWYIVNKDQLSLVDGQEIAFTYQLSRAPQPAICGTVKVVVIELKQ